MPLVETGHELNQGNCDIEACALNQSTITWSNQFNAVITQVISYCAPERVML